MRSNSKHSVEELEYKCQPKHVQFRLYKNVQIRGD